MILSIYLFILCIIYALYKNLYYYAFAWFLLFITSFMAHNHSDETIRESREIYVLDRCMIALVIFIGIFYYITNENETIITFICFILVIIIFIHSFNPCLYYVNVFHHELVHTISVIGHLSIIYYI